MDECDDHQNTLGPRPIPPGRSPPPHTIAREPLQGPSPPGPSPGRRPPAAAPAPAAPRPRRAAGGRTPCGRWLTADRRYHPCPARDARGAGSRGPRYACDRTPTPALRQPHPPPQAPGRPVTRPAPSPGPPPRPARPVTRPATSPGPPLRPARTIARPAPSPGPPPRPGHPSPGRPRHPARTRHPAAHAAHRGRSWPGPGQCAQPTTCGQS